MDKPKYKLRVTHFEDVFFGRYWHIEVKDLDTGEIILKDETAEDCTEEQAMDFAHRLMRGRLGINVEVQTNE